MGVARNVEREGEEGEGKRQEELEWNFKEKRRIRTSSTGYC